MLMMLKESGAMVELSSPAELWNPFVAQVHGCRPAGEEMQDQEAFAKTDLMFLSGEHLPRCWLNPHYRDEEWLSYRADTVSTGRLAGPMPYYGA